MPVSLPAGTPSRGLFVTFEGGEGSGKSTLIKALHAPLAAAGMAVMLTREPGGSPIGPAIRQMLLDPSADRIGSRTEALLFAAERAHHADTVIRPAMEQGVTVLCDRYIDSSAAYQGAGRDLGEQQVRQLSEWATDGLIPDLTFLLDIEPEVGLARRGAAGDVNRLDAQSLAFHRTVREAFLRAAVREPGRFVVLDATVAPEALVEQVTAVIVNWTVPA